MLEELDRQNLFVVPLDDHRRWYRYHHLFADVLRAHLLQERPGDVAGLHRRASDWHAGAGRTEDAVRHALAAGDAGRAADLVEVALPGLRRDRREDVVRRWVDELPDDVVRRRPVLAAGLIGGLMASNDFGDVERRLGELEEMLAAPSDELVVVDAGELDRVPASIELWRAGLSLLGGDPADTIVRAGRAIAAAPEGDHLTTAAASGLSGLASWASGDVPGAHASYTAAAAGLARAGHIADVLGCSITIADLELARGRLRDAERTLEDALALAERHAPDGTVMRGTADMLVGLSRIAWHRDDLEAAADLLRRADDLGEAAGLPQNPYRWRVAMARLRAAQRDWPAALALLDEAERVYVGDFSPPVHPIHATRARVLAASGDLAGAAAWAREHQLAPDDELTYLREYEHVTLARILLGEERAAEAAALLDRLLAAATAGQRLGTVIELEVLRARALRLAGDAGGAEAAHAHAVALAEPEGWVRYIVDDAAEAPSPAPAPRSVLPDPLSDRELDVLRLLGSELDGPGIARELVVSLNTVRTHTKHIYTKLGVNNRRAAVSRAHQLGLLSRITTGFTT